MTTQIKIRRDTAATWTSVDPVLALGEMGIETDTRKFKFGNGSSAWSALSYAVAPDSSALSTSTSHSGDVTGLYNALVVGQASGSFALTGDATITTTGTLNDYSLGSVAVLRWNGASALTLSSIANGSDGRVLVIENVTAAQELTITHDDGVTGTAANRFDNPGQLDFKLPPRATVFCIYDSTTSRWRMARGKKETFSVGGTFFSPTSSTDIMVWRAPFSCTVTNVRSHFKGGTSIQYNARKNQASDHLSADATNSTANAWADGGAVQNTSYGVGDDLELSFGTVTGSVTEASIQVDFYRYI